jgi:CheY-like chemotaxis protein
MVARRLLVVDDADDIRAVAVMALRRADGLDVVAVGSGAEAIEQVRAEAPDAVLLDVSMPAMDGPTTLGALRADGYEGPVLLLTAASDPLDDRFDGLGVIGVVAKPFDPMKLGADVRTLLGWTT